MIKRVHVRYLLVVDPDVERPKVERVYEQHMSRCPVYRSISAAIECTTELELADAHVL